MLARWRMNGEGRRGFVAAAVGRRRASACSRLGAVAGDIVTLRTATGAKVTWVYVTDPEGNIIELQSWSS